MTEKRGPGRPKGKSNRMNRPHGLSRREAFLWYMEGDQPTDTTPWMWGGLLDDDGYGIFIYGGKRTRAHRAAYELFNGSIPPGLIVRHRNDTPPDCNPLNLLLGTHADNARDRVERGRSTGWRTGERKREQWEQRPRPPRAVGPRPVTPLIPRDQWRRADTSGAKNGRATLTEEMVLEIRAQSALGKSNAAISREFGVSGTMIGNIIRRVNWKHI
ncbi:HNH endonuclease [Rhodococcus phage Mbo2]|uniref:HNH endonuclease n=1 Tax=Rhodococcus phage Mbo2 TaxID=2936911 RepID=A0A9E7IGP0_9CAUD|nr:HNH endonuclease [Rhodococcus phage Mbo2]